MVSCFEIMVQYLNDVLHTVVVLPVIYYIPTISSDSEVARFLFFLCVSFGSPTATQRRFSPFWVCRSLSPTASQIVSGGDDKTVRLWDVEQKTCVQTFYDSASSITCPCAAKRNMTCTKVKILGPKNGCIFNGHSNPKTEIKKVLKICAAHMFVSYQAPQNIFVDPMWSAMGHALIEVQNSAWMRMSSLPVDGIPASTYGTYVSRWLRGKGPGCSFNPMDNGQHKSS